MKKSPNFLQSGDYFFTFRGSTTISLPKLKSLSITKIFFAKVLEFENSVLL